ncbi:hypothetical protein ABEV34_29110 [Methylorubrum rhodesianum]|uniref:hypothetical protein n=1 Tax=Methylorubrum TaxID=2282523 RepID=UPI0017D39D15|nr:MULTISPECIES: hypothetical protein [Methylorubrum]MBB5762681.1 hypothetical protein [Methylorubrum rhodesianum]
MLAQILGRGGGEGELGLDQVAAGQHGAERLGQPDPARLWFGGDAGADEEADQARKLGPLKPKLVGKLHRRSIRPAGEPVDQTRGEGEAEGVRGGFAFEEAVHARKRHLRHFRYRDPAPSPIRHQREAKIRLRHGTRPNLWPEDGIKLRRWINAFFFVAIAAATFHS